MTDQTGQNRYGRRALLKGTAQTAGLVGAGTVAGAAGVGVLTGSLASRPAAADEHDESNKYIVSVGELDEYMWHPEMSKEAEFLRSKGAVARYTVEKGQPHRLDTLAGANAGRLFDGFEETRKGCSQ